MITKIIRKISSFLRYKRIKNKHRNNILCKGRIHFRKDTNIIIENGKMVFGKDVSFQTGVHITAIDGGVFSIGDNCAINRYCVFVCRNSITIGDNVIFGPNVTIFDHDHKFNDAIIERNEFNVGDIVIENGCWIGANVTILRNTHVGENSIIGAGCVVKGNVPPHSLVTMDRTMVITPITKRKQ